MRIIRARYFDLTHLQDVLRMLHPRDFEFLIGALYESMGYEITVTQASRDGGYDIKAERSALGASEIILVECKLLESAVGVEVVRALSGVVDAHRANKGVIVAPSSFTKPAKSFASSVKRIELLDYHTLNNLLNRFLGTNWPYGMDSTISTQKRKQTTIVKPQDKIN